MEQILCNNANAYPDAIAIVDGKSSYQYKDLMAATEVLATDLRKRGIGLEEPVCILLGPGTGQIISQVAVLRAGGTCVPVDPSMADARLHDMLTEVDVRFVITTSHLASRILNFDVVNVENAMEANAELANAGRIDVLAGRPECHRSHLLFTSGSTGKLKGVQIPSRAIIHLATTSPVRLTGTDRVGEFNNPGFDLSLFEIWVPLLCGATIVCIPKEIITDPFAVGQFLTDNRVTAVMVPSSLFVVLAMNSPNCFRGLNHVLTAGERASGKAMRQVLESEGPPQNLWNAYGPTECTCYATIKRVTVPDTQTGNVSIGHAFGQTRLYIMNENMQPILDTEHEGEICIGGPGVSLGYVNRPEANTEKFVRPSPEVLGEGYDSPILLYRTGDLGKWRDVRGSIDYIGRSDTQIKRQGYRVELGDIENTLQQHESVRRAVVVHVKDQGDLLIAFVLLKDDVDSESTCLNQMMHWISKHLPHYMIPNHIRRLDRFPLTSNSKVDRKELRDMIANDARCGNGNVSNYPKKVVGVTHSHNCSITLGKLQEIVGEIMGIPHIDPEQDIATLGLSSLGAAKLLGRFKQEFGKAVSMFELYENSTINGLAHLLQPDDQTNYGPSEILQFEADSHLGDDIELNVTSQFVPDWMDEGRVFLTGATGFLGANLLQRLVKMPTINHVACFVRGQASISPKERIESNLRRYDLWDDSVTKGMAKVIVLEGDMTHNHLGLEEAYYQWLIHWAPTIIHAAAKVNWCAPYSAHFAPNVIGTRNVLSVAAEGRCKSFHYVSSIDVWAVTGLILGTDRVSEDGPRKIHLASLPFDTGYAQSQWVVDEMVQRVRDKGMPVTIYRPGFVVGNSKTGAGNPDDFFSRMVIGCIQLGYWPELPEQNMEYVTSDYVCDGLLHIAANNANLGKSFNLTAGDRAKSTYMDTLCTYINEAGFPLEQIPFGDWVKKLHEWPGLERSPLLSLMPLFTEPVLRGDTRLQTSKFSPVYECTNTQKALADSPDIHHIEMTSDLVGRYIQFWIEKGYHTL